MTVASFFRKYSVGCIFYSVGLIIPRKSPCIYTVTPAALRSVRSQHNVTTYNENLKLTSDPQLIVFRSLR
jgi:hypothetical protein